MELHASSNANKKELGLSFSISKIGVIVAGVIILAFFAGKYLMSVKVFGSNATNIPGTAQLDPHLLDAHSQPTSEQNVIYGVTDPQTSPTPASQGAKITMPPYPSATAIPTATPAPTATKAPTPTPTQEPTATPTPIPTAEPSPTPLPVSPTGSN